MRTERRARRIRTTLLQLVEAVRDAAANECEAIAALRDWLERGAPRLCAVPAAASRARRKRR